MNIIDTIEKEGMKQNLPEIAIGDTVRVNVKVVEGTRERIQTYEGIDENEEVADDIDLMTESLTKYVNNNPESKYVVVDFKKAMELFEEELASDYSNAVDTYKDITFKQTLQRLAHHRPRGVPLQRRYHFVEQKRRQIERDFHQRFGRHQKMVRPHGQRNRSASQRKSETTSNRHRV